MIKYSFLSENIRNNIKKFLNADNIGKKLTYVAAGGYGGASIGGVIGTLYGVKVYKDKDKFLNEIEKDIRNPETSIYTRQKFVDIKNLIQSMTDEEYKHYIITNMYERGKNIGRSIGTIAGGGLAMI